jgi:prepilin-type N-terminal cleavage/methylation domain-containing protein
MVRAQNLKSKGFTLLEVLVTLTILTMLLGVIFGCLHMGIRAWEKGEEIAEENQEMRIVKDLISQQIRSIYPYRFREGNIESPAFKGEDDSIRFISTMGATSRGAVGLTFVSYFIDPSYGLMLCEKRIFDRKTFEDEWNMEEDAIPFSSLVSEIAFEYEGEEGEEGSKEWDANKEGGFPHIVRVSLRYKEKLSDKEATTTLTIPLIAKPLEEMPFMPSSEETSSPTETF